MTARKTLDQMNSDDLDQLHAERERLHALLRDAENYLSALHGSVARHDNLAANYACAGCELRNRIAGTLRPTPTA